jgi:regulator of protease activity HflC (stomatin/prohibitin superfamily)
MMVYFSVFFMALGGLILASMFRVLREYERGVVFMLGRFWRIKVSNVEIKHVDLNENMIRAIAKQAEAERDRRAKVIHAEGEYQASKKH